MKWYKYRKFKNPKLLSYTLNKTLALSIICDSVAQIMKEYLKNYQVDIKNSWFN